MIDFPNSPTVGQVYAASNGIVYVWNGTLWTASSAASSQGGDFCAVIAGGGAIPTSAATLVTLTVATGNSGGWFVPATGRFTPPPGRYEIFGQYTATHTAASHCMAQIRKNGTVIQFNQATVASAGYYCNPTVVVTVDANGTDWFDMQVSANAGATGTYVIFGAFPISGIKGPPGDPPTAGGGIIREVTLASPANAIDLFSLGVKSVDVMFHLLPNTATTIGRLRLATGTTINTAGTYFTIRHYANSNTAGADSVTQTNGFALIGSNSAPATCAGRVTFPSLLVGTGVGQWWHNTPTGVFMLNAALVGPAGVNFDGLTFSVDTGAFSAGSFVRVIGWP